jgi:hypothetical protein
VKCHNHPSQDAVGTVSVDEVIVVACLWCVNQAAAVGIADEQVRALPERPRA